MKNKKNRRLKRVLIVLRVIAVLSFITYVAVSIVSNTFKAIDLKRQQNEVVAQIEDLKNEKAQMESLKEQYSSDTYIEKLARERLGLVKPNEKILIDISRQ